MSRSPRECIPFGVIAVGVIGLAVYYSIRELAIAGTLGFPLDDSWIHMVFARSIARGDFFAYNPHHPVAGSTSPLWTILLGIAFAVWHDPIVMPKVIGVALNITLGILMWKFAERLGLKRFPAIVTALLIVGSTHLVWASLSGMEVSLYVTLCFTSMYAYVVYAADPTWKFLIPWIIAGVAVWARPELALQPVFFVLHQLIIRMQRSRPVEARVLSVTPKFVIPWNRLFLGVVAFSVCMVPYVLLNESLSNAALPLTFTAKTSGAGIGSLIAADDYFEIIRRLWIGTYLLFGQSMTALWMQDNLFVAIASCVGLIVLVIETFRRRIDALPQTMLVLLALNIVLYAPIRSVVTGLLEFGQYGRYAAHTGPLMMLFGAVWINRFVETRLRLQTGAGMVTIAAAGVSTVVLAVYYSMAAFSGFGHQSQSIGWDVAFLHQGDVKYIFVFALWAVAVAMIALRMLRNNPAPGALLGFILLQFLGYAIVENVQVADEYAWNVRNINDTQVLLGKWLHETTPPGTMYATNDIGAMAYYADGNVIVDVVGLVQPEITDVIASLQSGDRVLVWAMDHWKPTYLICFDEWYRSAVPEGRRSGALERVKAVPIVHNITCGGRGIKAMNVYAVHPEKFGDYVPKFIP